MIEEHLEIPGVNTLIFQLFGSYSDGKLFEIGSPQQPLQLNFDFIWGLCVTKGQGKKKIENKTLPDIHSITFIYTHSCATIIFNLTYRNSLEYLTTYNCNYSQYETMVPLSITRLAFLIRWLIISYYVRITVVT